MGWAHLTNIERAFFLLLKTDSESYLAQSNPFDLQELTFQSLQEMFGRQYKPQYGLQKIDIYSTPRQLYWQMQPAEITPQQISLFCYFHFLGVLLRSISPKLFIESAKRNYCHVISLGSWLRTSSKSKHRIVGNLKNIWSINNSFQITIHPGVSLVHQSEKREKAIVHQVTEAKECTTPVEVGALQGNLWTETEPKASNLQ
jgi:hypothetical protein